MIERSSTGPAVPPESEVSTAEARRQVRRDRIGAACAVGFVVAIAFGLWLATVSPVAAMVVALLSLVPGWWGFRTLTDVGPRDPDEW